mmetsp:Transcript_94/g.225  ORF Transcript_94/g.225 Transcript_94/m.225 type:complete len:129 (-) Transcript_94:5-391(-)
MSNILIDLEAETCVWARGRVPYHHPTHGGTMHQEILIDGTAKPGDHVKIADAWVGHYPSLKGKKGTLVSRAGQFWSVKFEGQEAEILFNDNKGLQQLALDTRMPLVANLLLSHPIEITGGPDTKAEEL